MVRNDCKSYITFDLPAQAADNDGTYSNLIFILGQFRLASNYMDAVPKIMQNRGADVVLAEISVCKLRTANKIFVHRVFVHTINS